jgi:transcription elongation GreA/GreB family factor
VCVYTSLRPEDIVTDGTTPLGTKALRNYLEYARTGHLVVAEPSGGEPESEFEVSVINVLRQHGYESTPQLGVAGYRIDVAVKHPDAAGVYLAAIECDGATYHSAATVRDRDRIRQEILESLGWRGRVWRIWSTDWFRAPQTETRKLLSFLDELRRTWHPEHGSVASWTEEGMGTTSVEVADATELLANALLPVTDDREVQVGDFVRYCEVETPDDVMGVRIVRESSAPQDGVVAAGVPLAQALLGSLVGDEVSMHVPGSRKRSFRIIDVKRPERTS